MPLMFTDVAPVVSHVNSTRDPGDGEGFGSAVNELMASVGTTTVFTVTAAVAWALPTRFVATMVYVVVAVGFTACDPVRATSPTVGEMVTLSAFSTIQSSVELPPVLMVAGVATKRMMRGRPIPVAAPTVTTMPQASCVTPFGPKAVIVYAVVCVGDTVAVPVFATLPMPGLMLTDVAF